MGERRGALAEEDGGTYLAFSCPQMWPPALSTTCTNLDTCWVLNPKLDSFHMAPLCSPNLPFAMLKEFSLWKSFDWE